MESLGEENTPSNREGRAGRRWKKNLRRIPDTVALKVKNSKTADIVVACTRKISADDIIAGVFIHLGIRVVDGQVEFPSQSLMPSREVGKYSERNIDGRTVVRKDLPM